MSDIAIKVSNLSKRYRIGLKEETHDTFMSTVSSWIKSPFTNYRQLRNLSEFDGTDGEDVLWALKDISFEVNAGEVIGVIGRNGAGKSTLLKILSRITEPSAGRVEIRGRVSSLLEVGTGFHPELTGRENVYLNGAVLGMSKKEIDQKFDDIVAFAEVERFIDTAVKRYSSGMAVRLAFAVAAHLEPEILLVDEVLSVGDVSFQKKCLGKMDEVTREGRTVLFVSHNMGVVNQLCPRSIWLHDGKVRMEGRTSEIISAYLTHSDRHIEESVSFEPDPSKASQVRIVRITNAEGEPQQTFSCDDPVVIELWYEVRRNLPRLYGCFQISAADGTPVLVSYSYDDPRNKLDNLEPGLYRLQITVPPRSLAAGKYLIYFSTASTFNEGGKIVDDAGIICSFTLDDVHTRKGNSRLGYFSTLLDWDVEEIPAEAAGAGQLA